MIPANESVCADGVHHAAHRQCPPDRLSQILARQACDVVTIASAVRGEDKMDACFEARDLVDVVVNRHGRFLPARSGANSDFPSRRVAAECRVIVLLYRLETYASSA